MKRLLAVLLMLAAPRLAAAQDSTVLMAQSLTTPALERPLTYIVYLPPGLAPGERANVIYLMHGVGDSGNDWYRQGRMRDTADMLIRGGVIRPVIIVMPDADSSWYVDSRAVGGPGDYESAITRDLVAEIDRRFPTRAGRDGRAVAGTSMGGYGALRYAFAHPDRFSAAVALSPALWGRVTPEFQPTPFVHRVFGSTFGDPFDPRRFVALNPFGLVLGLAVGPRPAVLLMAAHGDFGGVLADTRRMHDALRGAGVTSDLRLSDGVHDWAYWAAKAEEMLIFIDRALPRPALTRR